MEHESDVAQIGNEGASDAFPDEDVCAGYWVRDNFVALYQETAGKAPEDLHCGQQHIGCKQEVNVRSIKTERLESKLDFSQL